MALQSVSLLKTNKAQGVDVSYHVKWIK